MVKSDKVVIIGGGFGGLQVARRLGKSAAEVLVIDKTNHHLFQPLLYQVASAALTPADIATPIRQVMRKQKNAVVIMGDVERVDKERKVVILGNGEEISFDYLVLAVGARHSYFGREEWEAYAPGIKTLEDSLKIREKLLMSFERAERSDSISEAEKYLNHVVIGGGPTGVEVAGAIAEIAHRTMIKDFRRVNVGKTKIYLVEGASQLLLAFPKKLADKAQQDLEKLGVEVILNKMVTDITAEGVQLGDDFIPAKNVIWAAGNQASPLLKTLDIPLDRQGRAMVGPDCSIPGYPNIFVVGDAAHFETPDGTVLPGIAPAAIQQGRYVAKLIAKNAPSDKRKRFKYTDKGMMATIGTHKAVAMTGDITFTGYTAWLAWGLIHIAYLVGYRSRFLVISNWIFQYWTGQRGARLINQSIKEKKRKT